MVNRRPGYPDTAESTPTISGIDKHPYVPLQRNSEKSTESQKEGVRVWNSMVSKLREAGLMEDKK